MSAPARSRRAIGLAFCVLPVAFLIWLFHDGLRCWFIADDFAWLGLLRRVHSARDLIRELFAPAAQGTIRPWSERGFFILFAWLFGMDDLPFRITAFATMAFNLLLLNRIVRRITGSPLAGFVAAMVWGANTALMTVMTWSSAYNEAMCAAFMLGSLWFLIRFAETGLRRYWILQFVIFLVGFGALEINVVYPAIAVAYAIFVAPVSKRRHLLLTTAPLIVVSVVYFFIHWAAAPLPLAGPYALRVDSGIFGNLWLYSKLTLSPADWEAFGHAHWLGRVIRWTEAVSLVVLLVLEARRRRRTALFFLAWYLAAIAPVLPLANHQSDYYLTIPLAGFGMLAGFGVTCAVRDFGRWRLAALVPLAGYFILMIPVSRSATHWTFEKTRPIEALVVGVAQARERHPNDAIVIDRLPPPVYKDSMGQGAFYAFGINDVYLSPESRDTVPKGEGVMDPDRTVLDPDAFRHALDNQQVLIYSLSGDHLRNVTKDFERSAPNRPGRLPERIDAGNPLYSWLLGPTWLPPDNGVRWMPGEAVVRLRGPNSPGEKLLLAGFCPEEELRAGSRHVRVSAEGERIGDFEILDPQPDFSRLFLLPDTLVGRDVVTIEIRVTPVSRKSGQEYGAVFGKIAIQP